MGTWAVAGCATVIFMSLYSSQDFATRLNFKIAPHIELRFPSKLESNGQDTSDLLQMFVCQRFPKCYLNVTSEAR